MHYSARRPYNIVMDVRCVNSTLNRESPAHWATRPRTRKSRRWQTAREKYGRQNRRNKPTEKEAEASGKHLRKAVDGRGHESAIKGAKGREQRVAGRKKATRQ